MNNMPLKLRKELSKDPYYSQCVRENCECEGRITWEHAIIVGGRQLQRRWAIIPLCVFHHLGEGLNKEVNQCIALCRATEEDLLEFPKAYSRLKQLKQYLIGNYGRYI